MQMVDTQQSYNKLKVLSSLGATEAVIGPSVAGRTGASEESPRPKGQQEPPVETYMNLRSVLNQNSVAEHYNTRNKYGRQNTADKISVINLGTQSD